MLGTKDGTKLNTMWKELGVLENVNIYHPNTFCQIEYNGNIFNYYKDIDKFEKELLKYSENDEEEIELFINAIKTMGVYEYDTETPFDLIDPKSVKLDMKLMRALRKYLKLSISELANRFNSEVIRYAFKNFLVNEYFGAFYFIQTLANFINGNDSLPIGCSKTIQDNILNKYLSLGGNIIYNSQVSKIIVKDNKAIGISLNGNDIYADYIISAIDIHYLNDVLLENKYQISPYKELDLDINRYKTYSYAIASFKTKMDFSKREIARIKKIEEYSFYGIKGNSLSIRHYGYDKSLIKDGYTTIQVYLTTYLDDYLKLKALTKEEYKDFKNKLGLFYLEKLKEEYKSDDFELIDVLTPLTYERYNNSYLGTFMTYALAGGMNPVVRNQLFSDIKNLVLAGQWILLPGGSAAAALTGKFAASLIKEMDTSLIVN